MLSQRAVPAIRSRGGAEGLTAALAAIVAIVQWRRLCVSPGRLEAGHADGGAQLEVVAGWLVPSAGRGKAEMLQPERECLHRWSSGWMR